MQRAVEHRSAFAGPAANLAGTVTLDYDSRHRRRIRIATDAGEDVLLDLPKAVPMADGDGLMLEDGRWLVVVAAPEDLVEVRTSDATKLARIGWHLGNRHLPAEIGDGVIRIRPDHVIEAMLARLGAEVAHIRAPFQPEGGAYSVEPPAAHADGHDHHRHPQGDADGHDHSAHGHSHPHDHDH